MQWFKVLCPVLAQRADEIRRERFAFVNIAADFAHKALLLFGSRLRLGYCDSASDVYQYQGQEYEVIGLEEATHFTEEQMQFLTTCNRTVRRDFSPRMYYTCNPGGIGHVQAGRAGGGLCLHTRKDIR